MSTFDDPNREAVGLAPVWTGAGDEPDPEPPVEPPAEEPPAEEPETEPSKKSSSS